MKIRKMGNAPSNAQLRVDMSDAHPDGSPKDANPFLLEDPMRQSVNDIELELYGNKNWDTIEGVFSFVLYYRFNQKQIETTTYYHGIWSYIMMAMKWKQQGRNSGILLFTDKESFPKLSVFCTERTKDILTICVVDWPMYKINDKMVEDTIMRCMRYLPLGMPQFEGKWIANRDADTLFPSDLRFLSDVVYKLKNKEYAFQDGNLIVSSGDAYIRSNTYLPKYTDAVTNVMGDLLLLWEKEFIDIYKVREHSIVIGTSPNYQPQWSLNYDPSNLPIYEKYIKGDATDEERKRLFRVYIGMYAGFVTFFAHRPAGVWSSIYDFLTSKYIIVTKTSETGEERVISNDCCHKIGKDERLILFSIIPSFKDACTLFQVKYVPASYAWFNVQKQLPSSYDFYYKAEEYGIAIPKNYIRAILRTKGIAEEMDANALALIQDLLTDETKAMLDVDSNIPIYVKDSKYMYPLQTFVLQPDYVKAMSTLSSMTRFGFRDSERYSTILNNLATQHAEWKASLRGGKRSKRTRKMKKHAKRSRKTKCKNNI